MARVEMYRASLRLGRWGHVPGGGSALAGAGHAGRGRVPVALLCLLVWIAALTGMPAASSPTAAPDTPDVVVVVDTSKSMSRPGMDPERTSLLVSKLLSDILPGELAVVRLLDLARDSALLPRRETGQTSACDEDPSARCDRIEPTADWGRLAREQRLGALVRDRRGDAGFKQRLDTHLAQTSANSLFYLAFRAAEGVFEQHQSRGRASANRTIIWLSDGRDEHEAALAESVRQVQSSGTNIETIIFGRGDPAIPARIGLSPVRVTSPGELMAAFAQAFRRIMRAPYRIDHLVEREPQFEVQPRVETMWVVVYGDTSLESVTLTGADGRTYPADYAADSLPRAGAYRVARIDTPTAGAWRLETRGGGPGRAYAVVQRSSLGPVLHAPSEAQADVQTRLVAAITPRQDATPITDPELLAESSLTASIEGERVALNDNGAGADEHAGDGLFSGYYRFARTGDQGVDLHLVSPFADAEGRALVRVRGVFHFSGPPLTAHLGHLEAGESRCVTLSPEVEHRGGIPFRLETWGSLPSGHQPHVRLGGERLDPDGAAVQWRAGTPLDVCLEVGPRAPSSQSAGERGVTLSVDGDTAPDQRIEIALHWEVKGLGLWQRWGWLIILVLVSLLILFIALGFILPKRFPATLAINLAPEQDDLDEYPPQSIRIWRGVGIGFYRDARAYVHPDYRLGGKSRGALARLRAIGGSTVRIDPQGGHPLYREEINGEWRPVPLDGEIARPAEVYRVGDSGPYVRLSAR